MKERITVRVDKHTLTLLGEIVEKEGISQSEAIRRAVCNFYFYKEIGERIEFLEKEIETVKRTLEEVKENLGILSKGNKTLAGKQVSIYQKLEEIEETINFLKTIQYGIIAIGSLWVVFFWLVIFFNS